MGIVDGERAVVVRIQKQRGTNEVTVAEEVIKNYNRLSIRMV